MMCDDLTNTNYNEREGNMYYGASPILFELSKELRGNLTPAEAILWDAIKVNQWHLKFRRQHPIAIYIADFYCHQVKLVIELDGGYHENKEVKIYDEERERDIKDFGITVLRFRNEEVINNIEKVLVVIDDTIATIQTNKKMNSAESLNNAPLGDGGSLFVIKIGGNIVDDETALQSFLKDFASIKANKILIHGGGKIATKIGEQLGIKSNYVNGRRITDAATIDLVTMVYGGLVNKKIVAKLQSMHCNAIGLTGADANIIPAKKRPILYPSITAPGEKVDSSQTSPLGAGGQTDSSNNSPSGDGGGIDYGFVGDVTPSNIGVQNLQALLANNFTLVFAPLTHDGNGQILNTNADTIASSLAVALSGNYDVRLIYCFEKKGVLENVEDENSVITLITKEKYVQLLKDKKLFDGILPKIDNAFAAIDNGVKEVLIGDANDLLQNVTANTIGTLIK
jgi:acetylglutamate kinase